MGVMIAPFPLCAESTLSHPEGARSVYGTRAFLTPTLFLFGSVLFQCMAVLFPWPSAWPVGIILDPCGRRLLRIPFQLIMLKIVVDTE